MIGSRVISLAAILASTVGTAASAENYYIQAGYPVMLTTRTDLSTRDNRAGDRFYMTVAENINAKGQVIIPAGLTAVGEIVRSERNGHFGKSGKMEVRVLYIDTPSSRIPLSGSRDAHGKSGTVPVVATALFVSAIGSIFIHGTSGKIRAGTPIQAYLGDDLKFAMRDDRSEQTARNYVNAYSGNAASGSNR